MKYKAPSVILALGVAALLAGAVASAPRAQPVEFAFGSSLERRRDKIGAVVHVERVQLPALKCQPTAIVNGIAEGPGGDVQLAILQVSLLDPGDKTSRGLEIRLPPAPGAPGAAAQAIIDDFLLDDLIASVQSLLADAKQPPSIPDAAVSVQLRHTSGLVLTAATGLHGERLVIMRVEYAPSEEIVWVLENDLLAALEAAQEKLAALKK